jgi:hypothetical protein
LQGARKDSVVVLNNIISRDKNSTNIVTKTEKKVYTIVFAKRVIVKITQQSHTECNVIIIEVVQKTPMVYLNV